jgi:catechol-2,3-dioxygenase
VPGVAALRHFHDAIAAEKVTDVSPVTHGNAISLYFRDPEGNRIELFFDTPWYCRQPVREPVDFARTDDEILADAERVARSLPDFKPREAWMAEVAAKMAARG